MNTLEIMDGRIGLNSLGLKGGSFMTNREWLNALTDEEFADWATQTDDWDPINNKPFGLSPHRINVERRYTSSYGGLLIWLKQERLESGDPS